MKTSEFSEFELLLLRNGNELGISVLLILAWIASSDGTIHDTESKQLFEISVASKHEHDIPSLIAHAKNRNLEAIQLASEIVKQHFQGEKANLFLKMAIGIAIADGFLLPTENHILRFLGDLLGATRAGFNSIFLEVTGRDIPEASDPSKASYWQTREKSQHRSRSEWGSSSSQQSKQASSQNQKTINAYAVLGLESGSTKEEIKCAYRRLAQIHHPDRFSVLGEESVAAATSTFQRIKEAYDYLMSYA